MSRILDPRSWILNPRPSVDVSAGYRCCCFKFMYISVGGAHSRRPGSVPTAHAPGRGGRLSFARAMPLVLPGGEKMGNHELGEQPSSRGWPTEKWWWAQPGPSGGIYELRRRHGA